MENGGGWLYLSVDVKVIKKMDGNKGKLQNMIV
jgi:hypothetical protein